MRTSVMHFLLVCENRTIILALAVGFRIWRSELDRDVCDVARLIDVYEHVAVG